MSSSSSRPIFQGQLQKRGKINTAWKLRWCNLCILKSGAIVLEYYDSQMSRNLCGTVDLSGVYCIEAISTHHDLDLIKQLPENVLLNTTTKSDQKYSIRISTSNRKYLFAAFDPPSFFSWINHLDKYIYGGVIKQGWMMKKGDKSRGWKKRYFVLNEYKQIKYYSDFEKTAFCGVINLHKVSSIKNGKVYSDEYKFTFELITHKRVWILCCKDLKQREMWRQEIKNAIGAENLSNHMTDRMKHNVQVAHLKSQLQVLSIGTGTSVELNYNDKSKTNDDEHERKQSELSDILPSPEALEDTEYSYNCTSIRNCKPLKRITMNLHFYQTMIEGSDDPYTLLLNYCQRNSQILNDYDHLLHHHLNGNDRIQSNAIFEIINDTVRKYVQCDIENCKSYQRNVRNRLNGPVPHKDPHVLFYIDLLDTMHTNFVHSFDIGVRINTSQCAYITDADDDIEMSYIHNLLKIKRKSLWRSPSRHHRYCTMTARHEQKARGSVCISAEHKDKAPPPTFEDDYVKTEEIAIGSATTFGSAYLCHKWNDIDKMLFTVQQMSKIKFYCIEGEKERLEVMQSMKNEIEMLRILKHNNVVHLHEIYEDRNFIYLVREHVQGSQLFPRIYTLQHYTEAYVADITKQILNALSYMQSNGVCHFNLKPQNIIFESNAPDALVKLIDFGTAQVVPKMTELKQNVVNVHYTAPEVLDGTYDRASDIWSVGVILFCMLFGYPAFYVDENAFNYFGKKEEDDICEFIKKGFNPEIRQGHGPWFPKDICVSNNARSIIAGMLSHIVSDRLSVTECLEHRWITDRTNDQNLPKDIIFKRLSNFVETCKFKDVISNLFTKKLNPTNYTDTLQVFQRFDEDNDSEITLKEFKQGMTETTDLTKHEMDELFAYLDIEHDPRTVSIDELMVSCSFNAISCVYERMCRLLGELDQNDNGLIAVHELQKVIRDLGEAQHMQRMDDIIDKLNKNEKKEVHYMDFVRGIHGLYNERIRRGTAHNEIRERYQLVFTDIAQLTSMNIGIRPRNCKMQSLDILNDEDEKDSNATQPKQILRMKPDCFGVAFNYTDSTHESYIKPKYADLKAEILCDLPLHRYEYALFKTTKFMKSGWVKRMESKMKPITIQHVFVVILYTDYSLLHHMIKNTFCKLSPQESDDAIKQRHSAYHHFCKLLYETVNAKSDNDASACGYYHALDRVVIPRRSVRIDGIISVTQQLEIVIAGIADDNMNGMILELGGKSGLNCNFLSWFCHENEKILFAPPRVMRMVSVSVLLHDVWHNFGKYISAIHVYYDVLDGKPMAIKPKQNSYGCIDELMHCELNKLQFVTQYFDLFCMEREQIIIDLAHIEEYNHGFGDLLIATTNYPLLRLDEILALFKNCKSLTTQRNNGKSKIILSSQYFDALLAMVKDTIASNRTIQTITVRNPAMQCTQDQFASFKAKFKQQKWIMHYDKTQNKPILNLCRKQ